MKRPHVFVTGGGVSLMCTHPDRLSDWRVDFWYRLCYITSYELTIVQFVFKPFYRSQLQELQGFSTSRYLFYVLQLSTIVRVLFGSIGQWFMTSYSDKMKTILCYKIHLVLKFLFVCDDFGSFSFSFQIRAFRRAALIQFRSVEFSIFGQRVEDN